MTQVQWKVYMMRKAVRISTTPLAICQTQVQWKVDMMRKAVRINTTPLAICQTRSPSIHYTPCWRNKDSDSTFSHHTQAHRSYQVWLQKVKHIKRNVLDLHTDGQMDKANQIYTLLPTQMLLPKEWGWVCQW